MTRQTNMMEITALLQNGLQELTDSAKYRSWLETMSHFHRYSFHNTVLIYAQKPDATYLAGYRTWQTHFDRQVRKGEKAIRIIAPIRVQKEEEEVQAFRVVSVFDLSQTTGKPLPVLHVNLLEDQTEQYEKLQHALIHVSPVPISFETIQGEAKGYYTGKEKRIVIQKGLPQVQTLKTMIHEIAHARLHHDSSLPREIKEMQAESIAYVVCYKFGLDTSQYSFPYIAKWNASKELTQWKQSCEIILHTASQLVTEMERYWNV